MERIYITNDVMTEMINVRRYNDHLERYLYIRRWMYGVVLDIGCGIGYGSNILSSNQLVRWVYGVDIDENAIEIAKHEFQNEKTTFLNADLNHTSYRHTIDVLVAIEFIEHLEKLDRFQDFVRKISPKTIIISFPNKPSKMFNKFHYHDFVQQDIIDLLKGYIVVKVLNIKDVTIIMFVKAPDGMPFENYRNILDV